MYDMRFVRGNQQLKRFCMLTAVSPLTQSCVFH